MIDWQVVVLLVIMSGFAGALLGKILGHRELEKFIKKYGNPWEDDN